MSLKMIRLKNIIILILPIIFSSCVSDGITATSDLFKSGACFDVDCNKRVDIFINSERIPVLLEIRVSKNDDKSSDKKDSIKLKGLQAYAQHFFSVCDDRSSEDKALLKYYEQERKHDNFVIFVPIGLSKQQPFIYELKPTDLVFRFEFSEGKLYKENSAALKCVIPNWIG